MRLIQEIIIVALETLGLLMVAAGLGMFAARWIGWAALAVTGLGLLGAAALAARQQRAAVRRPAPATPRAPSNGQATDPSTPTAWAKIFKPQPRTAKP